MGSLEEFVGFLSPMVFTGSVTALSKDTTAPHFMDRKVACGQVRSARDSVEVVED